MTHTCVPLSMIQPLQSVTSDEDDDEDPHNIQPPVSLLLSRSSVSSWDSRRCLDSGGAVGGASQAVETLL